MSSSDQKILIVDDEPDIRNILQDILNDEGFATFTAENAQQAKEMFNNNQPDLVLLDIWMPNEDGISVLKYWVENELLNSTPVIMISGHGSVENAVEAVKLGAYDFLEKPLSTGKLLLTVERGLDHSSLKKENSQLKSKLVKPLGLIANSESTKELTRHIKLFGPTDSWVFISGESGTGKRLVAKQIHQNSPRKDSAFVELNLAATPTDQVAKLLFGSEDGSTVFKGYFELAQGGTLFINEILDLNLESQNKLYNALQEQQFLRLNGNSYVNLNIRVIASSSRNAEHAVEKGEFRQDLYYFLNVIPIYVPSLVQRHKDLPNLISIFIEEICLTNQLNPPAIEPEAFKLLTQFSWPGNVRQLQNVLQRLILLSDGEISQTDVEDALNMQPNQKSSNSNLSKFFNLEFKSAKEEFEKVYLKYHLDILKGNVSKLAQEVGLERTHLYRKLKNLNLNAKDSQ